MIKSSIWAALLFTGVVATAHAHARLLSSTPADGSTVAGPPPQVVLGFSEVAQLAALTLARGSAPPVAIAPLPPHPAQQLTVPLPTLKPGTWTLGWRAIGDDGHITHGSVHFTVAPAH